MDSIQYIIRQARRRNLDPNAVLAVFGQEGLSGRIGDQGTSFGPGQLHMGGALPTAIGRRGPRYAQQWAWSPAGINYALDRIAGVAAGKRGQAAVQAIVTGFERPANPGREIAGASRAYGRAAGPGRALAASAFDTSSVGRPQPPRRAATSSPGLDVSGIINLTNSIVGLPPVPIQVNLPGRQTAAPPRRGTTSLRSGAGTSGRNPGLPPRRGGRSLNWLEHFAAPFGVQVTSTTGGNHVKNSYHYRGRAVDFGGDPHRMAALQRQALKHPESFTELFYTGPGAAPYFIKDGKLRPLSELDPSVAANHRNHVHAAR